MIAMFISSHFQKETKAYNCKCNFLRHLLYFPASLLGFPSVFSPPKFPFFLIASLQNMNTAFVFMEPMWRASRIDVPHKSVGCAFLAGCCMVLLTTSYSKSPQAIYGGFRPLRSHSQFSSRQLASLPDQSVQSSELAYSIKCATKLCFGSVSMGKITINSVFFIPVHYY